MPERKIQEACGQRESRRLVENLQQVLDDRKAFFCRSFCETDGMFLRAKTRLKDGAPALLTARERLRPEGFGARPRGTPSGG